MFYLKRKIGKCKFSSMSELYGLEIKPRNKANASIKVKAMLICDDDFKNNYIAKQLDKRFSKLYDHIYNFLVSEDDSEQGVKGCLTEIEKAKSVIFNKYKEHMKNKLYKEYLARIVLTENEFRNKYLERQYFAKLIEKAYDNTYSYDEELNKGKSR